MTREQLLAAALLVAIVLIAVITASHVNVNGELRAAVEQCTQANTK